MFLGSISFTKKLNIWNNIIEALKLSYVILELGK